MCISPKRIRSATLRLSSLSASLQLDGPVGVVEEGLPAGVTVLAEAEGDEGIAFGSDGPADEFEAGLFGGAAAFAGVAAGAGADEVVPGVAAALSAGLDVIEGEFAGGEMMAAVLTAVAIAREDVAAVEFYALLREAVVAEESDDARDGKVHAHGADPLMLIGFELAAEEGEFGPGVEVVVDVLAVLDGDDLGEFLSQEAEGAANGDDADGEVESVEDEDLGVESGFE